ncbi:TIGR04190 family B12-binding domain/radical SAM domain protein [bacterium]|nr:TIGR04190 family B12-binding domain/radical SAM domain protein [bacterium]
MKKTDLILIHPPSYYDFRKNSALYGPVSDVVPSTQVFEMYPIGFVSMLEYLHRHGFRVRIINLAYLMLRDPGFNPEKLLKSLNPNAFGIDLHWAVHTQGSLEIAEIIKKHHSQIPVIFGGLTSSFFHDELINYPHVDYVLRGDSVEEPLRQLMDTIKNGGDLYSVPNLTWKEDNSPRINQITHIPDDMSGMSFDYTQIVRSCIRHRDIKGHIPFQSWLKYPIVATLSLRGCKYNCSVCGGSSSSFKKICNRNSPAYMPPVKMAEEMAKVSRYIKGPIIILGDLLQAGRDHAYDFLNAAGRLGIKNHVAFEFFSPPDREFLEKAAATFPNFNIQMSPESHDDKVRRKFGRPYDTQELEKCIFDALDAGCKRFDIFFMIGIPAQTTQSVIETIQYCDELLGRVQNAGFGGKVHPFIAPLSPFLDPGSKAFMNPEEHGYHLLYRSLEEHRLALTQPSWKYMLNYETDWMTRNEIVEITYDAALKLNQLKKKHGLETDKNAEIIASRISDEREILHKIDKLMAIDNKTERDKQIELIMTNFNATHGATICRKDEMNWHVAFMKFNPFRILVNLLKK